jgi:inhibitor of KinA
MTHFRAVADRAVQVEFGDHIADHIHAEVLRLDRLLARAPIAGMVEAIPAYTCLLVVFDPLVTDHDAVKAALRRLIALEDSAAPPARLHRIAVCYDADLGTDLEMVARQARISVEAVINAHLAGEYRVYLYGFAPGYAYLAGVPPEIRLPRKPVAQRDVPAGRVIIAGPQCIVTTLTMPTGWWIIGASPDPVLQDDPARPFRFDLGDALRFYRVGRAEFSAMGGRNAL